MSDVSKRSVCSKKNCVLEVYGVFAVYHLGFSSKQFQSYNKSFQACSGPSWENSSPWSFCIDLAMLGPFCQDLGPIFSQYGPRAWLTRYISCPLGTTHCVSKEHSVLFPYEKSFIDHECIWSSWLNICVFMDWDKDPREKKLGQYPAIFDIIFGQLPTQNVSCQSR